MSRVEPRIKIGSKVIWSEQRSGHAPVFHATLLLSGTVWRLGSSNAFVEDIKVHSLDITSDEGLIGNFNLEIKTENIVSLDRLKSIDDLRYKK